MIAKAIRQHFGIQLRPFDRLVYRKPYLDLVDRIPLLRGNKTPDFSTFSGKDVKSTMEHMNRFMAQCGEAKLRSLRSSYGS